MAKRRPRGRNITGILLLDKPVGMTSNSALQEVKRLFRAAKAGHTGSLDPLADGLLPICFGEATKMSAFLLDSDKRYRVQVRLGITTTTADAEGEVLARRPVEGLSPQKIEEVLAVFRGDIQQLPPMFSAVKHQGQRLYELARQGIEVERKPRTVHIYELMLVAFGDDNLDLEVHCSKGTYVRTLAEDIGERLGCGAHVATLRRTAVGPYDESGMVTLERVRDIAEHESQRLDDLLLPIETVLGHWPEVRLSADAEHYLCQGQPVLVPRAPSSGWVRLYAADGRFIGAGEIDERGLVAPRRLIQA
jgi:tRNA pseudouridine55 synthase